VALVAPPDDKHRAIPIHRIAAVTFTRRAAGELRLRVRESILKALSTKDLSQCRRLRLLDALGKLDGASLGTIHGFADRLLRLQPMKAKLSPSYRIAENIDALIEETFTLLLHAVQSGTLAAELVGEKPAYVTEVARTYQEALRAGLLVYSKDRDPIPPAVGLDALVRGFIDNRDRELTTSNTGAFNHKAYRASAKDFLTAMKGVDDDSVGTRWLFGLARRLEALLDDPDPLALYELVARIKTGVKRLRKMKDFIKDSAGQIVYYGFIEDGGYADQLVEPLKATLAGRLARTRHAVVRIYEQVKTRHEAIDTIDLLLTLRNLLRDDLEARSFYQGLFDHILVDELQDTDPLQAEVLLYLSEAKPKAKRWQDVVVVPGRLTLVGDPKQSIYGFRRADVGMYQLIREQITRADHVAVTLSANFRSTSTLIAWANHRFADILGTAKDRFFDAQTGQVFHQKQVAGAKVGSGPAVHALPYAFADGAKTKVGPARQLEGETIASYLRWLVERSDHEVRDPDTGQLRAVRWSDIAVLALVTSNVRHLTEQFDAQVVPYAVTGGVLFMKDPLHQSFLLGLRALADRNDGVAEAALLRPPFFGIDLLDLIRHKAEAGDEPAARGAAAREWLRETRRKRFERSPGQTARALLEDTGLGRAVALGPNGAQRLRHLRELCLHLEARAAEDGLDYDGITARMRDWVDHPPKIDPPRPVGVDAVQVLTVHQAKGLEFPVVVLWDGVGQWTRHDPPPPLAVDRSGAGWTVRTNDLTWEEPRGGGMLEREQRYANAERQRLVYVAATRARDLLIVPKPSWEQDGETFIHARLLDEARPEWVHQVATYVAGKGASWSKRPPKTATAIEDVNDEVIVAAWAPALAVARTPHHQPTSITAIAKAPAPSLRVEDTDIEIKPLRLKRIGRFGSIFGDTVHQAIGLVLTRELSARAAVERAAMASGLTEFHDEAAADVLRAVDTLRQEGLVDGDRVVRIEYPIVSAQDGMSTSGYIDLVSATASEVTVIDFKTDQWPPGATDATVAFPEYVKQVRAYAATIGARHAGLLFTVSGRIEWTG
jgi:ATP-dependent exoDNAse (exonuclease V) beta subunit